MSTHEVTCTRCRATNEVESAWLGRVIQCYACKGTFTAQAKVKPPPTPAATKQASPPPLPAPPPVLPDPPAKPAASKTTLPKATPLVTPPAKSSPTHPGLAPTRTLSDTELPPAKPADTISKPAATVRDNWHGQASASKIGSASPPKPQSPPPSTMPPPAGDDDYRIVLCTHCSAENEIEPAFLGQEIDCYSCGKSFVAAEAPATLGPHRPDTNPFKTPRRTAPAKPEDAAPAEPRESWLAPIRRAPREFIAFVMSPVGRGVLAAALLILVASSAYWGLVVVPHQQAEARLNEMWREADEHFRAARFGPAHDGYGKIAEFAKSRSPRDAELGETMQTLAGTARETDNRLEEEPAAPAEVVDPIRAEQAMEAARLKITESLLDWTKTQDELKAWEKKYPGVAVAPPLGGIGDRFAYPPQARWESLNTWLLGRLQKKTEDWKQTPPSLERAGQYEAVLTFLKKHQTVDAKTETMYQTARDAAAYRRGAEVFRSLSAAATNKPDPTRIEAARAQWRRLKQKYAAHVDKAPEDWKKHITALRQALREKLKAEDNASPPGRIDNVGPPTFSADDFARLATLEAVAPADADGAVFIHVLDRCLALDARTGRPDWVCRIGFDAPWLPRSFSLDGRTHRIVGWQGDDGPALTVLNDAWEPIFNWHLPAERKFAPPLVSDDLLTVLIDNGEVWQFELTLTGVRPRRKLQLPEDVHPLCIARPDGRGLAAVGKTTGIYTLETGESLRLDDVLLTAADLEAASMEAVWAPPVLITARNLADETCRLRVFLQAEDEWQTGPEITLEGRLWQSPVVRGSQVMVKTDRDNEAIYAIQPSPTEPLALLFQSKGASGSGMTISRPYVESHRRGSFITADGPRLQCFRIDAVLKKEARQREVQWKRDLASPEAAAVQPLQVIDDTLFVVSRATDRQRTLVEALDVNDGAVKWRSELAAPAVNVLPPEGDGEALVVSEANALVAVNRSGADWTFAATKTAAKVTPRCCRVPGGSEVVWLEDAPPTLVSGTERFPLAAAAVSAPAVWDARETNHPVLKGARWVAWIDRARNVRLQSLDATAPSVAPLQLSDSFPSENWFPPQWTAEGDLLLANPSGVVLRVEAVTDATGGLLSLAAQCRPLEAGLVGGLCATGDAAAVASASTCVVFDRKSLRVKDRYPLSATASTAPIGDSLLAVGGVDGGVTFVRPTEAVDSPTAVRKVAVSSQPIHFVTHDAAAVEFYVVDDAGLIVRLNSTGEIVGRSNASAPLAHPPLSSHGAVLAATVDGTLESLSLVPRVTGSP